MQENCLLFLGQQATLALHPQSNENPIKQETALLWRMSLGTIMEASPLPSSQY